MSRIEPSSFLLATALAACCALSAAANTVVFDEARDGDASDNRFTPTTVALGAGVNLISGFSGRSPTPDVHDLDYITFTVPEGYRLSSFAIANANVGGGFSFVAIEAGPIITIPADWQSIDTPLLGWAHFGTSSIGRDILEEIGMAPGAVGFTGALPSGTYAMWIMELNTGDTFSYSFALGVTPVPAPSVAVLLIAFGTLAGRRGRSIRGT